MKPKQINTIQELITFAPKLVQLHHDLKGKWAPGQTSEDFLNSVFDKFLGSYYYGEIKDDKVQYFMTIHPEDNYNVFFWLLYVDPHLRDHTKSMINYLREHFRSLGYSKVFFSATRFESSYRRWVTKLGAKPVSTTYMMEL